MTQIQKTKSKKTYIEIMRILAILFVVFNHTNTEGFVHFVKHEPASFSFWLSLFLAVLCKFGAPLFFVISGALLLSRPQQSIRITIRKRVLKYLLILLFLSGLYAFSNHILIGTEYDAYGFFTGVYKAEIKYHLWFLYAYIAFLLLMPLLQSWCQHMENKHFLYIIIIHFVFRLITIFQYLLFKGKVSISSHIIPTFPINIVFLPIIGYYLECRINIQQIRKKEIVSLWGLNFLCIGLSCFTTYIKGLETGAFSEDQSQSFFSTFAFVNCISMYLTIKHIFNKKQMGETAEKAIRNMGASCFGIYMLHPLFKDMPYIRPMLSALHSIKTPQPIIVLIYVICMIFPAWVISSCARIIYNRFRRMKKLVI